MFYVLFCIFDTIFNLKTSLPKRLNKLVYLKPPINKRPLLDTHYKLPILSSYPSSMLIKDHLEGKQFSEVLITQ